MATSFITSFKCTRHPLASIPRPINVAALCWKNLMRIYRNPGLLLFQFFIPAFQIILFSLAIGRNLTGIKVAFVNEDTHPGFNLSTVCTNGGLGSTLVDYSTLGELYISKLIQNTSLDMIKYSDLESAIEEVRQGKIWTVIHVEKSFTKDLAYRHCTTKNCTFAIEVANGTQYRSGLISEVDNGSAVRVYSDVTNLQITTVVNNFILEAYDVNESPIHGRKDLSFTDYMAPGMILSITFGISIALCAVALIVERNEGLIDRTWVAGVNAAEIIIAQVCTQFFILLVQVTILLVVVIWGFQIYTAYLPNVWVIGALALLQGLAGMAFGLFLSALCTTENAALQAAVAVFYPTLLLSGVLWPLEGMPTWLRYISYTLPCTIPSEAMRGIMGRGWGLDQEVVFTGFLVTIGWVVFFLFSTSITFNVRK